MSETDNDKNKQQPLLGMAMAGLASQIGCLTVLILFAALFGGLWLDKIFDSKPIFTIFLVLVSAPLALGVTFWVAMRAAKKVTPPVPSEQVTKLDEEEELGE